MNTNTNRVSILSLIALVATLGLLAGCGAADGAGYGETSVPLESSTTTAPVPTTAATPTPLVVIAEVGGCYMLGPNCRTFVVFSDGTFGAFRNDPAAVLDASLGLDGAEYGGTVDVSNLSEAISETDFGELRQTLPAGECTACFDGIDYEVRFVTASGAEELSSAVLEFDVSVALFAELDHVIEAVSAAGNLEIRPRGS